MPQRECQSAPPLEGFKVSIEKDAIMPVRVCAQHLSALGAQVERKSDPSDCVGNAARLLLTSSLDQMSAVNGVVDCAIAWHPHHPEQPGHEALVQAISGLMEVHGRDRSVPRRLGLDVASVAAGIVATQGVLAALIGNSRDREISGVRTSVLEGALQFLYHHIAIATCGADFPFRPFASGQGPPFATSDGFWVELEAMTGESWKTFWERLGVSEAKTISSAWLPFVYRYLAGKCTLPDTLHEATLRHTLAELQRAACDSGVTLGRLRSYHDLLHDLGWPECGQGHDFLSNAVPPWSIEAGLANFPMDQLRAVHRNAPLSGVRVVEVTSRLQGPLAGLLLQMLGAEILKVEPPGGDFGRFSPPLAGSTGAAYLAYNRNKKVIEIDYKSPEGRRQLSDLTAGADVFLHNWRSGRAEVLGLDFEHLSRLNPRLVYAHASAWGRMEQEPSPTAGDFLVQAYAACGDGLNPVGESPFPSRLTLLDATGGLLAGEGILAALWRRECDGRGSRVETSLFSAAVALQQEILRAIATHQEEGRYAGRPLWGWLDQPLETAHGFIMVLRENANVEREFLEICDIKAGKAGPTMPVNAAGRMRTRTAVEWEQILRRAGISCAVVRSDLAGLSHDSELQGLLQQVDGASWAPAKPWHFETLSTSGAV